MGFVQHIAAFSSKENRVAEMSDWGRLVGGLQGDACEELICPKPRRVSIVTCTPEPFKPFRQCRSVSPATSESEAGYEILEIFHSKGAYGEPSNFCRSPPYFCGSPPSRAGNPLVHDLQFVHQRLPPPSPMGLPESKSLSEPSFRASPSVRVEGFDCSARDSRYTIATLA